jgi:hypothetical protein
VTEIYRCGVCSCQEILRRNGRGQAMAVAGRLSADGNAHALHGGTHAQRARALRTKRAWQQATARGVAEAKQAARARASAARRARRYSDWRAPEWKLPATAGTDPGYVRGRGGDPTPRTVVSPSTGTPPGRQIPWVD